MLKIAILDPNGDQRALLTEYLARYRTEKEIEIESSFIKNDDEFVENIQNFDVAIMRFSEADFALAKKLRRESKLPLIFIAEEKNFDLTDYRTQDILGVLHTGFSYPAFYTLLDRADSRVISSEVPSVAVNTKKGIRRVSVDEIYYLESTPHHVVYHLKEGDLRVRENLSESAKRLTADRFFRLGGYLVNLQHVYKVWESDVYVGTGCLPLPRNKKADFLDSLLAFMNRG
ncbi:MAG: LytTR family transcriptional regulator [Clostridia bacterium]|nr:LytTR family transcriptional regulator [Clostridia bacterium]